MAGLLKYFNLHRRKTVLFQIQMARDIPSSSIGITNTCVHQVQQEASSERRSRGPYISLTPAQKFSVGKRAAENGVTAMLHYYSKTFPDLALKEATVTGFKNNYLLHINDSTRPTDLQELRTLQKVWKTSFNRR